ncbi:hypothetical protein KSP39_PZI013810 [Platanthera zijinensis]|uniref:Transmembrane protein n=1 Tax=Platanthera zijinensis TaxID=2320716 RepID=A0AAP0BCV2_9ASPA
MGRPNHRHSVFRFSHSNVLLHSYLMGDDTEEIFDISQSPLLDRRRHRAIDRGGGLLGFFAHLACTFGFFAICFAKLSFSTVRISTVNVFYSFLFSLLLMNKSENKRRD